MMLPADQRALLGDFLRARREAARPASSDRPRRRTPGLRREDVAERSGISTTWYTWIEQGRDISLSPEALARVATALALSPAERAYLFDLARCRDPAAAGPGSPDSDAPSELLAVLQATAAPAYLLDPRWHVRGWNAQAGRLFAPWLDGREPCLLRFVFLDPAARGLIVDWEDRAQRLVAEFRADMAHAADPADLAAIATDLRRDSPAFAQHWRNHAVLSREGGERIFDHPEEGRVRYRQTTLVPTTHPDHKLVILMPAP